MAIANGMLKPDAQALLHRLRRPGQLFRKLFRCIVPDNGTEFSDPEMVENYHPRPSLGGRAPYDLFVEEFGAEGKRFLDKLGIVRIPQDQVTLHPFLLGRKFQKAGALYQNSGGGCARSGGRKSPRACEE